MEKTVKNMDGTIIDKILPQAEEVLENAKAKGSEYWEKAKAKGQDILTDAQSTGKKTWGRTMGFYQKHPAQVVGCAVLVGIALGAILVSKLKD